MHNRIGSNLTADHQNAVLSTLYLFLVDNNSGQASLSRVLFPTIVRTSELNEISRVNAHQINDVRGTYFHSAVSAAIIVNVNIGANSSTEPKLLLSDDARASLVYVASGWVVGLQSLPNTTVTVNVVTALNSTP